MKNIAKKHHYLPRFYLNGFKAKDNAKLCILDQSTGKSFYALPKNIAFQNNLYSIEQEEGINTDKDALEKGFSKFEALVAPVLREMEQEKKMPRGKKRDLLLNFIALMYCRVPAENKLVTKSYKKMPKMILQITTSTKERFAATLKEMKKEGIDIDENIDYQETKKFINSNRYTIEVNQNFKMKTMNDEIDILIPWLARRKWSLIFTDDSMKGFICSDNPVALVSLEKLPPISSPGFAKKKTEVTMPLSKNIALLGRFEGKEEIEYATPKILAAINSRTRKYADRFIFSAEDDFLYITKEGTIGRKERLVKDIIENKKENR